MTAPSLTVAIVTHDSAHLVGDLLSGLRGAMAGVDGYDVIVADNASTDGTPRCVRAADPNATVVTMGRNAGYAAGINASAARGAGRDGVLVLNPDVRLAPGSVTLLLQGLGIPGTGIAVPRLRERDGRLAHSLRREPTVLRALGEAVLGGARAGRVRWLGETVVDPAVYGRPGVADWATGAAMLVSRGCLDRVGPWNETFFLYSEETDFALRARDAGLHVRYVPEAEAVHIGGAAHVSPELWTLLAVNRVRLYAMRHGGASTAAFRGAVILNEALRSAGGRPTHRAALRGLLRPSTSGAGTR